MARGPDVRGTIESDESVDAGRSHRAIAVSRVTHILTRRTQLNSDHDLQRGPSKGADAALIREFIIEGLYGYRTISLASPYAATILIARNGTGKTTLLGALDAFLRMQLGRLRGLDFALIRCRLDGVEEELVLTHDDVVNFLQVPEDATFNRVAARASLEPKVLFNFIVEEYLSTNRTERLNTESKVFASLASSMNYSYNDVEKTLEQITDSIFARSAAISSIRTALRSRIGDMQIVYLPTYRRVELALTDDEDENTYRRRRGPKIALAAGSLFTGDIQFGLGDISERLGQINGEIVYSSNNGYREISANIINDLIDGRFERHNVASGETPSRADLKIFFSRLREGRRSGHYPSVQAPDLEKLYDSSSVPESSKPFLDYFLNQLGVVIKSTKALEEPIDLFVNSCNKYLLSEEPSTDIGTHVSGDSSKRVIGKKLCINRQNLRVHVESSSKGRKISLNSLSSGEKQMISLFAKLFLYPREKIVLIDEPELSLSIDWQSQILVDVLNAPLCRQVIAITHSPFVFDNELDPFARSIKVDDEEDFEWFDVDELEFGDEDEG